ncbi:ubiquitin-2 like Rad60 SUMO-like-domain-containing protein [Geopyxis carbonaria]|nr:ubiquitin-2 like Rad60 SUMO-like-domain-containing protein [Geopyxis carbonaria]
MSHSTSPEKVRPKKPQFNKPKFQRPTKLRAEEAGGTIDFFRRSKETYLAFEDTRSKVKAKAELVPNPGKRKSIEQDVASDSGEDSDEDGTVRRRKNAKATRERYRERAMGRETTPEKKSSYISDSPDKQNGKTVNRESSLTPPPQIFTQKTLRNSRKQEYCNISSDDEPTATTPMPLQTHDSDCEVVNPEIEASTNDEEDEYFAKIAARARNQKQRSVSPGSSDPVVKIFVSSPIPNTAPVILKRRLTQTLKEVRQAWCDYNNFTPEQAADIFFFWKGNKIFDYVSSKGIGVKVDCNGNLFAQDGVDLAPNGGLHVHLEAVTKEIVAERERRAENGDYGEMDIEEEQYDEPTIKLVIKAKGMKDFGIKVRPTTTIEDVVKAFKESCGIDSGKTVTLNFDGDDLESSDTVADTELEDGFMIDAYIS